MTLPPDRARRPPLPGPRLRGAPAHRARVPGVDRAQRLRPRHHADRAVRVDDRDDRSTGSTASPTSCTSRCSSCSGSASTARPPPHTRSRFRLSRAGRPSRSRSPAATRRSGRCAPRREESVVFQVDEDFVIPPARPAAYVVQRGGESSRTIGVADGDAPAAGRRPAAVRDAAAGRRRPVPRLRGGHRSKLLMQVDDRRRRWPAAPASTPRIRRCAGRSPAATDWLDCEVLEDLTGGFNYGSGTVELQLPAAQRDRAAGRQAPALAALPHRREDDAAAPPTTYTHPPEIYSITAAPIGALLRRLALRARGRTSRSGSATVRPARSSRCARTGAQAGAAARRSRSRIPSRATGSAGSCGESFVGSTESTATSTSTSSPARSSSARRSARPTAAGRSTARSRRRARVLRFTRYRHGGGRDGNVAAHDADDAAQRDPRRRHR